MKGNGKRKKSQAETCYMTSVGQRIEKKLFVKDLGVTMSHNCLFKKHIENVMTLWK